MGMIDKGDDSHNDDGNLCHRGQKFVVLLRKIQNLLQICYVVFYVLLCARSLPQNPWSHIEVLTNIIFDHVGCTGD